MTDARQQRGIINFVAVEIKNRQHRAIALWTEKLVDVPGGREWSSLRLPVADYGRDNQIRIIKGRAAGVRQDIAELAAFMNRSGRFRRAVTADAARKREVFKEVQQPFFVQPLLVINLGIRSFEIDRTEHAGRTVTRSGHENHVEIVQFNDSIQV